MSTEFNELLKIRNQKENRQRKIVQDLEREIEEKKPMLQTLEQSIALFKNQKAMIEKVFFDQISGQEMKPESLSEYQNKVKQISQFDKDLNIQYQSIVADIQKTESLLGQARQDLISAKHDVEKIGMLVKSEQVTASRNQTRAEEALADEQANEAWNRQT